MHAVMLISSLLLQPSQMPSHEAWLVGDWAPAPSSCETDSAITFESDGTYNDLEGEGAWALAGQRLMVSSTGGDDFGRSEVVQIKVLGSLEMQLEWPDGTRAKFHRCVPQG